MDGVGDANVGNDDDDPRNNENDVDDVDKDDSVDDDNRVDADDVVYDGVVSICLLGHWWRCLCRCGYCR
jgi:hypothetical protein